MFRFLQTLAAHFPPHRSQSVRAKFARKLEVETLEHRLLPTATLGPHAMLPPPIHNTPPAQVQILRSAAAAAASSAVRLEIVARPVNVSANTPFSLTVEVVGRTGQVDSSFHGQVTVTVSGAGNSTSSITVTAVQGVASFSGLTITNPGVVTLVISSPGLAESKVGSVTVASPRTPVAAHTNHGQNWQAHGPVLFSVTVVGAGSNGLAYIDDDPTSADSDGSDSSDDSSDDGDDGDDGGDD